MIRNKSNKIQIVILDGRGVLFCCVVLCVCVCVCGLFVCLFVCFFLFLQAWIASVFLGKWKYQNNRNLPVSSTEVDVCWQREGMSRRRWWVPEPLPNILLPVEGLPRAGRVPGVDSVSYAPTLGSNLAKQAAAPCFFSIPSL